MNGSAQNDCPAPYDGLNWAVARAMRAVVEGAARVRDDPMRPRFHFRPPARWMNDPNGPIHHNGWYHVFYQHNPYGDTSGQIHWGHTRSRDLVHWEHLPIALWPSEDKGEAHCYSGCAAINGEGRPMLFYTSVPPQKGGTHEQWAAIGDADLVNWVKHPGNPILSLKTHGGPGFAHDWRDPFVFREGERTFLVLGAELVEDGKRRATVAIYEAADASLARWTYRGILFTHPRDGVGFCECPNFFRLGRQWVLFTAPFGPVEYFIGDFDAETCRFEPRTSGIIDRTFNFYASNVLFDAAGRCILLGWVRAFPEGRGWNGCLSLPRVLTLGADGRPVQQPVPELKVLRGRHEAVSNVRLTGAPRPLGALRGNCLEVIAELAPDGAERFGLSLRAEGGRELARISFGRGEADVSGVRFPFDVRRGEAVGVHAFLDRSVLEVFIGGRECVTLIVEPGEVGVELFAEGGGALVRSADVWEMKSIWL